LAKKQGNFLKNTLPRIDARDCITQSLLFALFLLNLSRLLFAKHNRVICPNGEKRMSRRIALDCIHLKHTPRWAHTQYSLEYHRQFLAETAGIPTGDEHLLSRAMGDLQIDLLWHTNDGLIDWTAAGRTTNMGHAAYAADGSDQLSSLKSPFDSAAEVYAFDAVREYGLPDFPEQVQAYEHLLNQAHSNYPEQLTTGGYYKTLVSGAIAAFGWEAFLLAGTDPQRLASVLDTFFQRTLFFMRAWAATSVDVVIQHDDFVWTSGPFLHPEFYRQEIIPRYAELWKPLHAAGKKVLFCSDGCFVDFASDIVAAGADGLIFEPCNDFNWMASEFGGTTCLVGSAIDCRDLAAGDWAKVDFDIARTMTALANVRGAVVAVGNHLPPDLSPQTMRTFFQRLLPQLERK